MQSIYSKLESHLSSEQAASELRDLSNAATMTKDWTMALAYLRRSYIESQIPNDHIEQLGREVAMLRRMERLQEARNTFHKAQSVYETNKQKLTAQQCHEALDLLCQIAGLVHEYDKMESYARQLGQLAKARKVPEDPDSAFYEGAALLRFKRYDEAEACLLRPTRLAYEGARKSRILQCYVYLGVLYFETNRYEKATVAFQQFERLARNDSLDINDYLPVMVELNIRQNHLGAAQQRCEEADRNAKDTDSNARRCVRLESWARCALAQHNLHRATEYLKQALSMADKICPPLERDSMEIRAYALLAEIARLRGDTDSALVFYSRSYGLFKRTHECMDKPSDTVVLQMLKSYAEALQGQPGQDQEAQLVKHSLEEFEQI